MTGPNVPEACWLKLVNAKGVTPFFLKKESMKYHIIFMTASAFVELLSQFR